MKIDDSLRIKAQDVYGFLWVDNSTVQVDKTSAARIWREDMQKAGEVYGCYGSDKDSHTPFMTKEELAMVPPINWNV
jgi:hypothetical protein